MIALLANRLILTVLLALIGMALLQRAEPPQRLPLIKADYPACVTINPGQLEPKKSGSDPYPRRKDVA